MLKSLLAAVAAVAMSASVSVSADLPALRRAAPIYAPLYWGGLYVGLNAGGGWFDTGAAASGLSNKLNGFVGGVQVGYNYQIGQFVVGIEGDGQFTSQRRSDTIAGVGIDQRVTNFETARLRAGFTVGSVLLYGTGGAGWVSYKIDAGSLGSSSVNKSGWAVGGGAEWMFARNWSVKAEYLRVDTGNVTVTMLGVPVSARGREDVGRVGVNYHF